MAEVSWVKLKTNIFSNRKISLLLNELDGDTYFRIWIQLITIAGEYNSKGRLIIGENVPITIQQLSKILQKSNQKVEKILNKFIELGMIIYEENCYSIKNWSKYQSADKLEEIRKNNRERKRKSRYKNILKNNVTKTLDNNIEYKRLD